VVKINKLKKIFFSLSSGQSLIELVVAISVILIGVVSTLVLSLTTIRGGKASEMQVVATNLAREGIEVVRQKRDSNWLEIESSSLPSSQWDQGLKNGNDYTAIARFDASTSSWTLDYPNGGSSIEECVDNESCRIYFSDGIFAQYPSPPAGNWEATPYYRLIATYEICQDKDGNEYIDPDDHTCDAGDEKIGIQVLSQVKWYEKDNLQSLVFEEHLYNWK